MVLKHNDEAINRTVGNVLIVSWGVVNVPSA